MDKETFNDLVQSLEEAIRIAKGEIPPARTWVLEESSAPGAPPVRRLAGALPGEEFGTDQESTCLEHGAVAS